MSAASLTTVASRMADLVAAVTAVAVELKQLDRRNDLLAASIEAGERHHREHIAQMAEIRDARIIEHASAFLDAFASALEDRHLAELGAEFRAFRARSGEEGTAEQAAVLARLSGGGL